MTSVHMPVEISLSINPDYHHHILGLSGFMCVWVWLSTLQCISLRTERLVFTPDCCYARNAALLLSPGRHVWNEAGLYSVCIFPPAPFFVSSCVFCFFSLNQTTFFIAPDRVTSGQSINQRHRPGEERCWKVSPEIALLLFCSFLKLQSHFEACAWQTGPVTMAYLCHTLESETT